MKLKRRSRFDSVQYSELAAPHQQLAADTAAGQGVRRVIEVVVEPPDAEPRVARTWATGSLIELGAPEVAGRSRGAPFAKRTTGRPTRTLEQWLWDHAAAFRP